MPPFLFVVFPGVECKIEQSCPRVCKNMEFSVRIDKNYDELCGGGMPSYAEKTFGSFKKWTNEMVDPSACESVVFLEVF